MDSYDRDTLKRITAQYPEHATIKFLIRNLKDMLAKNSALGSQLIQTQKKLKELNIKFNNKPENREIDREASILNKKDDNYKNLLHANKSMKKANSTLKKDNRRLIHRNLMLEKELAELRS